MAKFSIVIPVYNCKEYIAQAIESVIKQSYEDWELILVDDGSTDDSGAICEKYATDRRIKVMHTENSGELISRINGMKEATGNYILGCDADDFLEPYCLEMINDAVEKTSSDVIIYQYGMFGAAEGNVEFPMQPFNVFDVSDNILAVISSTNHSLCNKAIQSEAVKAGIKEVPLQRLSINADYVLLIPILCHTKNAYYLEQKLYNYRIYETSMSHNVTVQHLFDIESSTQLILQCLNRFYRKTPDMIDAVYIAYLKMFAWRCNTLLIEKKIDRNTDEKIHSLEIYSRTVKYETLRNISLRSYVQLKIFRNRWYVLLSIFNYFKRYINP